MELAMIEKELNTAHGLLTKKNALIKLFDHLPSNTAATEINSVGFFILVRTPSLIELIEKEIGYINRRLKSLGITELTS